MKARSKSRLKRGSAIAVAAIALVGAWEGLRTVAYRDVVGVPTVCYGETRGVKMGDRYSKGECDAMLGAGLKDFEKGMRRCLKSPDKIPDKTYVAFLSFSYNVGIGAFCRSTLVRKANSGDLRGACKELLKWVNAGGKRIRGLVNRRKDELRICLSGLR